MELIPNLQTSPVGSSIWLSSAYLPGAIVFVSRFYLTRGPIAGAGHSADESGFPARAEARNWGFGGTAGLRAISEETDRLARDTEMLGRFKTREHNPCARSRESNHLNEPRYRGTTRLPWQGKSPRVYPWREKQRWDVHQFSRAWSGHSLDERISVFVLHRVSASARTFRRKAAARAGVQSFPDGVTQFESLIRLPNRRRSSMNESTISTADRFGLGLGSVCSNV